jgi:cell division protein ZapA
VPQVNVRINGYSYSVGCEEGQEQHLVAMAGEVEGRIDSIKALGGQSGEARLLVLAALLMADELHDLRIEAEGLRAPKPARAKGDGQARRLGKLAARAEQIAGELELQQGGSAPT